MKIGIIGDPHIGDSLEFGRPEGPDQINFRLKDYIRTFNRIISEFKSRGVKHIVLAGDIFDSKHPTTLQINATSKAFEAVRQDVALHLIAGNHDKQKLHNATTIDVFNLLSVKNIHTYTEFSKISLKNLDIIFMPYEDRRSLGVNTNEEAVEIIKERLSKISSSAKRKIVVGHFMLSSAESKIDSSDFSMNEIILPFDMFSDYNAVFMGHLHKSIVTNKDKTKFIHTGSMERGTFGDTDEKFSFIYDFEKDEVEKITNCARNLFDIELDFSDKQHKQKINCVIENEILEFCKENDTKDSIIKLNIKSKECDILHINQDKIKKQLYGLGVKYVYMIRIFPISTRKLRNKEINETISCEDAIKKFIYGLPENKDFKEKAFLLAKKIISEQEQQ